MDYSEEAYETLLNMRTRGKASYDEDRYTESLKNLGQARKAFEKKQLAYEKNSTEEFCVIAKKARDTLEHARAVSTYLRGIMEGKISDATMTDTMYELHGYKIKKECDEIIKEYFGPEGYWMPGMPRR